MRILLVDDEKNFLELTKLSLEKENPQFQVDISHSAEKALDLLEERDYDAVVSDYLMPVMDGLEFLRIIREEREDDIPFIMFTGKGREDVAVEALNLGADQYLQKGGDPRSHYSMLARMIVQEVKHRKAGKALGESEKKYSTLIDDVIDELDVGVFILDSEFKVVWINNTMCQYFDLDRDKIIGKDKRQLIHGKIGRIFEDPDEFMEKVLATYDNNTYMENFECHVLPEGERKERYLIHKSQPIRSGPFSGGRVENYYDVTERKRAEEKLRESGRFMTNIMESAPIPMLVINRDTSIRHVNAAMERLTDFSSEELVGEKTPYPWWTEETLKETDQDFKIAMREGPVRLEELFKKKNGERFWVEITALPVYNGPEFEYFLANWVDITERKKAEEKIKKSEKEYRELVEGVGSIVMRLDTEGNIKFMNEYGRRFFGYSNEELRGKKLFGTIVPERDSEGMNRWEMVKDILKHPDDYSTYEVENIRKDGERVWVSWTNGTILDREGHLSEILFIGNDVTELKRAEDREEFLYSLLKHDVRNKEAVTQGNLDLLKMTDLSEKQLAYVEKAMKGSVEGGEIIEKVEMLQKVGRDKVEDVDLASVIRDVVVEYKPQSSERGIEIECPMDGCSVRGGPLLRELFRNLIDNSIKHSGGDRIRISEEELDGEVSCTIEDNGRGIPKDIWDKIFHRGFKSGEAGGTGIGLFIVMEIAKGYGGRVEVKESELGGARFDVHLQRS